DRALSTTPIDVPLPLIPARPTPTQFTIHRDGVYEVVIKIARPPIGQARTTAECLMGWDWGAKEMAPTNWGPPCREKPVVDVAWHLTSLSNQDVVNTLGEPSGRGRVQGVARSGEFSNDDADREITAFVAKQGWRYQLELQTFEDARALAFVRPRVVVETTGS